MGRKPNQLILEFFERGPKLEDASNRYQHTCKSCGEKFPKGRIDSLTNHLVKKCPAIGVRDRQRAILQFHDLPTDIADGGNVNIAPQTTHPIDLQYSINKDMSALETLAEVSRQHLTLTPKNVDTTQAKKVAPRPSHTQETNLLDQFLHEDVRGDLTYNGVMDRNELHDVSTMFQYNNVPSNSHDGMHLHGLSIAPGLPQSSSIMPTPLMMTASAAQDLLPTTNMTLEPTLNTSSAGLTEKFFSGQTRPQWQNIQPNNIDPSLQETHGLPMVSSAPQANVSRASGQPRPIAMNTNGTTQTHFTTDFSINQKPGKPKVRGRFTDSRRKEVQEVRKRGACIRCRMLKKPCSGDNPCSTCVSVESARLWKAPCTRTRIAECFDLYSASLHTVLAFHAGGSAKKAHNLVKIPGRIEATHRADVTSHMAFAFLTSAPSTNVDSPVDSELDILDAETDDIAGKMEQYIAKLAPEFHEQESSNFLKITLQTVSSLCGESKDGLLSKVLELWTATAILTDRSLSWHLMSNPAAAPSASLVTITEGDIEADTKAGNPRIPITEMENGKSYDLISKQLLGATEKRAATLSKTIMNDIERRLLQRQQVKPFETFMVAVLLLACVERMCWYFRTWEGASSARPQSSSSALHSDDHFQDQLQQFTHAQPDHPNGNTSYAVGNSWSRWPLDKPPASYSQQGERFSDILVMLLRMRAIPPKVGARASDGIIVTQGDDVDPLAKEWYESVAVTPEWLEQRAIARYIGERASEWEGKFCHKVVSAGMQ